MADCIPCHFEFEEEHVFPHLPLDIRKWLLGRHAQIAANGYAPEQVLEHAEEEMVYFRRYAPAHLVAQVEADHQKFHPSLVARVRRVHRVRPSVGQRVYGAARRVLLLMT